MDIHASTLIKQSIQLFVLKCFLLLTPSYFRRGVIRLSFECNARTCLHWQLSFDRNGIPTMMQKQDVQMCMPVIRTCLMMIVRRIISAAACPRCLPPSSAGSQVLSLQPERLA